MFIDFKSMSVTEIADSLRDLRQTVYNWSQMVTSPNSGSSRKAAGRVNELLRIIQIGEAIQRRKMREMSDTDRWNDAHGGYGEDPEAILARQECS